MVRNPFERLVSAYYDKMLPTSPGFTYAFAPMSRNINKKYRHLRTIPHNDDTTAGTATFEDFLNFIAHSKSKKDPHWTEYNVSCSPCLHKYDVIMKMETLQDDVEYLVKKLNINKYQRQGFFPVKHTKTDDSKMERTFRPMPKDLVSKIYEIYRHDFEMFGYEKPPWVCGRSRA